MKQFKTVFGFEMVGHLKNKAFVVVTIILFVVIVGVMFFPRIKEAISADEEAGKNDTKVKIALLIDGDVDPELAKETFAESPAFSDNEIVIVNSMDDLKKGVLEGTYNSGFGIHDLQNYTYYVKTISIASGGTRDSDQVMRELNYKTAMKDAGLSASDIKKASSVQVSGVPEALGTDQSQNFFYTYIMIIALYIVILLYGQMVATNVASEKGSKAMEVLITSAKPTELMFGKILAACVAGMAQLILIFGTAFASYQINASYWEDNAFISSLFNIPLNLVLFMLLFFLLGFLLYAMMFGAIGSMATKVEDINSLQTPITIIFVAAFMVVIFGMNDDVNNGLMVAASYIPFTSPMAMFTRIAMGDIAWFEIAISVAILIVSTIGIGIISARIYRAGVLHYGKAPSFGEMLGKAKSST
ncbi:MAG: ABC transporter permease [Eubacterium sp.]|nr:ABC transporter permease [Eubacterium sp.]